MHALHLRQTLADGSQLVTLLAIDDNRHADFLQRFRHLLAIAIIGAAVTSSCSVATWCGARCGRCVRWPMKPGRSPPGACSGA